jgi:hypothetical protein
MQENIEQNNPKKKSLFTWNLVGLGLLVIVIAANFYVWKARAADEAQKTSLSGNLAAVQEQIDNTPEPAAGLDAQLAAAQEAYAATQTGFPTEVDRNEVMDYLIDVAEENSVQILPLTSEGWRTERNGQAYTVLTVKAAVYGRLDNILTLIDNLHQGKYPTLAISDCNIKRDASASPGFPGEEMLVSADISLGIYTIVPEGDAVE